MPTIFTILQPDSPTKTTAGDIVQEVFIKTWKILATLIPKRQVLKLGFLLLQKHNN